jgi:hypothetical protein
MTHAPFLASAAVALFAASAATAGLLPTSVTVTHEAGNYRWTYAVVLPTDLQLQSGDYFTIYDFAGRVPGGELVPDGWTLGIAAIGGGTPDLLNPGDDPAVPNLTWTYTGEASLNGQIGLGNFWAVSSLGEESGRVGAFTSQTHRTSDGLGDRNITETIVPTGQGVTPPSVPEPTTLALASVGLPFVVALARRGRRRDDPTSCRLAS